MAEDDNTNSGLPPVGGIWPSSTPSEVLADPVPEPEKKPVREAAPMSPVSPPSTPAPTLGGRGPFGIFSPSQEADETPEGPANNIIDLMVGITPGRVMNTALPMAEGAVHELWDKAVKGAQSLGKPKQEEPAEPSSRESTAALPPRAPRNGGPSRNA